MAPYTLHRKADAALASSNVLVGDESALHFLLHSDIAAEGLKPVRDFSLNKGYASSSEELSRFNTHHPLFGGEPVSVLVPDRGLRIHSRSVAAKLCSADLPRYSAIEIRDGLYVASPELAFARLASGSSEISCAETGMNLCARYYIDAQSGDIRLRTGFLTTLERLEKYLGTANSLRGCRKASKALRWVLPNSGSPMETKMALLFRLPLGRGSLGLPFDAMNFDVRAGRHTNLCEQGLYCIDMVSLALKVGLE